MRFAGLVEVALSWRHHGSWRWRWKQKKIETGK